MDALPLPELWRLRTPSCLVRGVAVLKDEGGVAGVTSLAELLAPGVAPVEGLAEILFPTGLPALPMGFSTVMTDSFTHRTYVGVQISYSESSDGQSQPLATCAWSHLPEVAAPKFLKLMETIQEYSVKDPSRFAKIWSWLVHEVPAPPPGSALFLHGLGGKLQDPGLCAAVRAVPAGLPSVYVPLQHLLTRLSVSTVLLVTRLVLLEQKVLFVGSSVAMLTSACEAFSSILLFPLAWVHCYNPLLPSTDYLATPPPFLFGCLREIILKEAGLQKETFADSNDLLSSDLLGIRQRSNSPTSHTPEPAERDFTVLDLDTGDVYFHQMANELPALPEAAQSRLRFSLTELRAEVEAKEDLWPGSKVQSTEVQKMYLTFMADLLGDVASSLGPPCEIATAASVLSSFQEGRFLSGVSAKDKPFFESFVQTNAFLAYLQTLHLFGTSQSPFAEALRSLGHRKDVVSFSEVPEPPVPKMGGERGNFSAAEIWVKNRVGRPGWSAKEAVMELHLRWNSTADSLEHLGSMDEKILLASVKTVPLEEAAEKESTGGVLEALEAVLVETQGNDRHLWEKLACDPRLRCLFSIECPAAVPTHSLLHLMNSLDPHRLGDLFAETSRETPQPDMEDEDEDNDGEIQVLGMENLQAKVAEVTCARFARRLLAVANPAVLTSAEAVQDPLAALAFLCPEETSLVEVTTDLTEELAPMGYAADLGIPSPRVELLPFKGPKDTSVLNHRRFCNWTDRSPEELSQELVRDVYRACVAVEKGSSKSYKLLERLSEPLAELQCCSLQGKSHEVRLSFWLNCLNASTLLAALAPGRIGFHERPHDVTTWAKLLHTAQLEVQGEILSLTEMEQVIRSQNESSNDPLLTTNTTNTTLQLKRAVPLASFAVHRPTRSGFPPLRIFQAKHLQAQLELNAVHWLCREMHLDSWRKKVILPEALRWHLADVGGETRMLETFSEIFKRVPEQVELIGGTLPANWKDLILERPEKLRVEYQEVTWQFQSPEALLEVEKNAAAMKQKQI